MAVNITKTSHFTGGAGNPISFSQIRSEFGGSATNIKASTYLRNDDAAVDWNDESKITSRVPDATENTSVATDNNWSVDSLRDTISNYLVTQSSTNTELSYSDNDTSTWNSNLSKNVPKTFDVTGVVHADNPADDALKFYGNLYNLEIEVDENGAIYGEGGIVGGGTVAINQTINISDIESAINVGTFEGGSITITRYNDGVTGTEGHPVGSIGYFIDVNSMSGVNLVVSSVDPTIRASGLIASDNSIALSTGYPQTITSTRFKVAFDMTNSQGAGRQATYARSFFVNVTGTGTIGGDGGDALYVNNTYGKSDVKIRSFGKIWAGGGGGSAGNSGNRGESLNCFNTSTFTSDNGCGNATLYGKNPNGVRNRCRGGGVRRGSSPWNFNTMKGYDCGNGYTYYCRTRTDNDVTGGDPGNGGNGGVGRGFSNLNTSINASPHKGNSGNNGNTTNCAGNGNSSTGNKGNPGNSGGDFGQDSSGKSGRAIHKKNAKINYSTSSTVKGSITNI